MENEYLQSAREIADAYRNQTDSLDEGYTPAEFQLGILNALIGLTEEIRRLNPENVTWALQRVND